MRAHETLERAGRHGGFPARGSVSGLLAACPSDGSHDFYLSMMLDVPVPRVPVLRARLQDSRRGAQRASDVQEAGRVVQVQRGHGQTPLVMAGRGTCSDGSSGSVCVTARRSCRAGAVDDIGALRGCRRRRSCAFPFREVSYG